MRWESFRKQMQWTFHLLNSIPRIIVPFVSTYLHRSKVYSGGKVSIQAVTLHAMCHCSYFPCAMFRLVDLDCEWIRANDFVSSLSICVWRKINCLALFGKKGKLSKGAKQIFETWHIRFHDKKGITAKWKKKNNKQKTFFVALTSRNWWKEWVV